MNVTSLVGRLTKDLDLSYTPQGTAVGKFTLAVNRPFKNAEGNQEADFIQCVVWRKPAETLANYTKKGSQLGVVGRIQTRSYDNQQGQKVYVTEIIVENFTFLESKNNGTGINQQQGQVNSQTSNQSSTGGNYQMDRDPFDRSSGQPINIQDDDLPF